MKRLNTSILSIFLLICSFQLILPRSHSQTPSEPEKAKSKKAAAKAKAKAKSKTAGQRPIQRIFLELDKNQNQILERSEVPKSALKEFDQLLEIMDLNEDKAIDRSEMQASGEKIQKILGMTNDTPPVNSNSPFPMNDPATRLQRMDTNKDGVISQAEWQGQPQQFQRLDRDQDGILSAQEQTAAIAIMRRFIEAQKKSGTNTN